MDQMAFPALLGDKAFGGYYLQGFDVYLHQKVNTETEPESFVNNPGTILAPDRYGSFGSE